MRLVSSLAFASLALASLAVPAAFATPNSGTGALTAPKAPVAIPLAPKATPTATPTAVPTSAPTPLPTVLTMEMVGFPGQSKFSAPLLDFRLASSSTTPSTEGAGKISFSTFSVLLPLGANAKTLENYYQNGTAFPEVDVFIPPNTRNEFKLVKINSFSENVTNTQSTIQFALAYGGMEIETVATPNPLLQRVKAPALIPGHAP